MMVEMNIGIVCGCLLGIESVLAMLFPRLANRPRPTLVLTQPTSAHRRGSGHPEPQRSFRVSYPLADLSSYARNTPLGETDTFEALWTPEGTGSNYASASYGGRNRGEPLTPGAITVHTEFTVQEEITPCQSPVTEVGKQFQYFMDAGSLDWSIDGSCLKD